MKSASTTAPRVILLVGIPGAGKTFFAETFSETFGAPFVDVNRIRRSLTDQPSYSSEEQLVVNELALMQLNELLKTKKTILYEGDLEARTDRQELTKLIKKAGYEPLIVWVQTDTDTARRRATVGVRGHSKQHIISDVRFDYLYNRFTAPNEAEKAVVISGKHTVSSQTKVVLKRLVKAHQPAPTPPPTPSQNPSPTAPAVRTSRLTGRPRTMIKPQ